MFDWKGLLTNYKFWVAFLGVIVSIVLYFKGLATIEQLATGLTALAVIILGFVTYENNKAIKGIRGK